MSGLPPETASMIVLLAPCPLLLAGGWAAAGPARGARWTRRGVEGAAALSLAGAMAAAGVAAAGGRASWTGPAAVLPAGLGRLGVSVDLNALTLTMMVLVALVGWVVARYASRYLTGDPREVRFHAWLALTLGVFLLLIGAGNLWEFWLLGLITGLLLNGLLAFYRGRPGAWLAARKHQLSDRLADLLLLTAFILLARALHTAEFAAMAQRLGAGSPVRTAAMGWASGLVVAAAALKSAQFPVHSWLIRVMEAPTPVSALLHAGIIYIGTFLLLRLMPLTARIPGAGDALVVVGLVTLTVAALTMMTQASIKAALAYSTMGQMGFMLLECGLGLYGLALLHLVSHAVYKAHAFLSAGSVVDQSRTWAGPATPQAPTPAPASLPIAVLLVLIMAGLFRIPLGHQLALDVMGVILVVAVAHLIGQAWAAERGGIAGILAAAGALSALTAAVYFGLDRWFVALAGGGLAAGRARGGPVYDALVALSALVFVGLWAFQRSLPRLRGRAAARALYVHLYNDLYVEAVMTRLVRWLWPRGPQKDRGREPGTAWEGVP